MRYYTIEISDDNGKVLRTFTSYRNGANDPGALQVELDIPTAPYATPYGGAFVRIYGIPITEIQQASNYNFKFIKVYGGMSAGLPLANSKQSGLLVAGRIQQAFGNWVGVNMTLDLLMTASNAKLDQAVNLTINWTAGTKLADAIRATLTTAFPTYKTDIQINPLLVLAHDEPGFYGTLIQFAQFVKQVSATLIGGNYQGVDITLKENVIVVYDGTTQTTPKVISFNDMIGQATWIGFAQIQFYNVMRGDLSISQYIQLPPGLTVTTQQSYSQYKDQNTFKGVFQIDTIRHVGNFRQESGEGWTTIVEAHVIFPDAGKPATGGTTGAAV